MNTKELVRLIELARTGPRNRNGDGNFYVMHLEDMERFVNIVKLYHKNIGDEEYEGTI